MSSSSRAKLACPIDIADEAPASPMTTTNAIVNCLSRTAFITHLPVPAPPWGGRVVLQEGRCVEALKKRSRRLQRADQSDDFGRATNGRCAVQINRLRDCPAERPA